MLYQLEGISVPVQISHGVASMGTDLVLSARTIQALSDNEIIEACRWFVMHHLEIDLIEQARLGDPGDPDGSILNTLATIERLTQDPAIKQAAQDVLQQARTPRTITPPLTVQTSKPGYVYLIQSGDLYKIGTTADIEKRIGSFATILPLGCNLLWSSYTYNPRQLEAELHAQFDRRRVNGEWFQLEQENIDHIRGLP